jgi:hypothetical protein
MDAYLIENGSVFSFRVEKRLMTADPHEILSQLTQSASLPLLAPSDDCGPVRLNISKDGIFAWTRLKSVRMSTAWRPNVFNSIPCLTADFKTDEALAVQAEFEWRPWFPLVLAFKLNPNCSVDDVRLFGLHKMPDGAAIPKAIPFGNCDRGGWLCTGFDEDGDSFGEVISNNLDRFRTSPWNADLISNFDNSRDFFHIRADNKETIPVQPWEMACLTIGNSSITTLVNNIKEEALA